jgi:hypothetical protein
MSANELSKTAISALKAMLGKPVSAIYGHEVHAEPLRSSASLPKGAIWLGTGTDFITFETVHKTSKGDQDYHLLDIKRGDMPLDLPFNVRSGAIGPCSLIELSMPGVEVQSIDIVQMTAELDDIVVYDHSLTFHDSILAALIVRKGEAQSNDPEFEKLETRMTLK